MSLTSRVAAGFGTALVAVSFAAPALAEQPAPKPTMPATIEQLAAKLPPFPGENATDAQIEAWFQQASKALGLPPFPGENATDAQAYTYVKAVVKLLGLPALPAMDASDAEYDAWAGKVATMFGLPKPPSANASEAQWDAWFTTLMGMSGMPQMPGGMPHKPGASHASSKPAGPVVQTDRVAPSSNTGALTGAAALAFAAAGVTLVMRRRASR
ncbi:MULTISPECIES: hypothetical protein [Dermacoccus]|uniref:hypothetical protein n=1 Tax=Dermacoccus TaxID=57495 RepID=UPI00093DDC0A|nr:MULTISPECIES: hypothetical protein [Dermacoccus]MBO1757452.1 hypothetical protein [Dermacoccus sp. NHGro5]